MPQCTVRERDLFGFPRPGDDYWNEQTLADVVPALSGHGHDAVSAGGPVASIGATDALGGFGKEQFTAQGKTRDLYRLGSGPAVIVIAEIPGITPKVAEFARRVAAIGCTAVLPHLFGEPRGRAVGCGDGQVPGPGMHLA